LVSEVDKLLTYCPTISKSSIDNLVEPGIESNTFELAAAVFARNDRAKALRIYQEQRDLRVEPVMIIGSLAWQLHLLALIKTATENSSAEEIAEGSGFSVYAISKAMQLGSSISYRHLVTAIDKLALIDSKSKSVNGYNTDDALRYYLVSV
jgi:DNA polymerase III delta subunit